MDQIRIVLSSEAESNLGGESLSSRPRSPVRARSLALSLALVPVPVIALDLVIVLAVESVGWME